MGMKGSTIPMAKGIHTWSFTDKESRDKAYSILTQRYPAITMVGMNSDRILLRLTGDANLDDCVINDLKYFEGTEVT